MFQKGFANAVSYILVTNSCDQLWSWKKDTESCVCSHRTIQRQN